jgi:hypothetical protein
MAAFTYTGGFRIKTPSDITSKMMVLIIDQLHVTFGPGYSFAPEAISEGGILFADWPGRQEGEYKTLRIQLFESGSAWPYISDTTLTEWRAGLETIIFRKGCNKYLQGGTFLKAFHGAPCWTIAELRSFRDAFAHAGITCLEKLPTEKSLCAVGGLGNKAKRFRDVQEASANSPKKQKIE